MAYHIRWYQNDKSVYIRLTGLIEAGDIFQINKDLIHLLIHQDERTISCIVDRRYEHQFVPNLRQLQKIVMETRKIQFRCIYVVRPTHTIQTPVVSVLARLLNIRCIFVETITEAKQHIDKSSMRPR